MYICQHLITNANGRGGDCTRKQNVMLARQYHGTILMLASQSLPKHLVPRLCPEFGASYSVRSDSFVSSVSGAAVGVTKQGARHG